jgi:hypothetical protein
MGNCKNGILGAAAIFLTSQVIPQFLWGQKFYYHIDRKPL